MTIYYACYPELSCCNDPWGTFFIAGDLLYWTTHTTGLDLGVGTASIYQQLEDYVLIIDARERDSDPHFDWKTDFKIASGYQSMCKTWELAAIWTYFNPSSLRKGNQNCDITNRGHYSLEYNQIDLLALYNISSRSFNIRPYVGIRGTRIDSKFNAELAIGICYNLSFYDSFQLCMKLGFEHHQYFNQNRMVSVYGDLSFDGGIFSDCLAYKKIQQNI